MKPIKIFTALLMSLLLTSCLEVDDDGNEEVAAAVNAQTQAIQDQNDLLQQQIDQNNITSTLFGAVVDAQTNSPVAEATLTVSTAGVTLLENVQAMQGEFVLEDLPPNTSIVIEVSSDIDAFLPRAFFMNTGTPSTNSQTDIGLLRVSEGVEKVITITDTNGQPFAGLEFLAQTHSGTGFNQERFAHRSEFDEAEGVYRITLPRDLGFLSVSAIIDVDGDNLDDFFIDSSGTGGINNGKLFISFDPSSVTDLQVEVTRIDSNSSIEFRISILDENGLPLSLPQVSLDDETVGRASSTFDSDSNQHVITVAFDGRLEFLIPAFTENDVTYDSSTLTVRSAANGLLDIFPSNGSSFRVERQDSINLPLTPRKRSFNTISDDARILVQQISSSDSALRLFFSEAVSIDEGDISLTFAGVTAVRGNSSTDDIVDPGTTRFSREDEIAVELTSALSGTSFTLTPGSSLIPGLTHGYLIDTYTTLRTGSEASSINRSFSSPLNLDEMSFDDVVVDNDNETTDGQVIIAATTDDVANTATDDLGFANIYFPTSLANLENLTVIITAITDDGTTADTDQEYQVVQDGRLRNVSLVRSVQLARNEIKSGDTIRARTGLAVTDNEYRFELRFFSNLRDNTDSSENSVSLSYSLERQDGTEETGTVTLPVL